MVSEWLIDFIKQNPNPSLSFIPIETLGGERVVFCYQDAKEMLSTLEGEIFIQFHFYTEVDSTVMRMNFITTEDVKIKTHEYSIEKFETHSSYAETVFQPSKAHQDALSLLAQQDSFYLFLYDPQTRYSNMKEIDFKIGAKTLNQFRSKQEL